MSVCARQAIPAARQACGRVIVVDDTRAIERSWHGKRTVVLEFDAVKAARNWYRSPEYQEVVGFRHIAADSNNRLGLAIAAGGAFSPTATITRLLSGQEWLESLRKAQGSQYQPAR